MQSLSKNNTKDKDLFGYPGQIRAEFGDVIFDSCFDSGNLCKVERVKDGQVNLKNARINFYLYSTKHEMKTIENRSKFYVKARGFISIS